VDTVGVGVVGCGFVGLGAHVPAISKIDGADLVAVADADEGRLGKAVRKYGAKATYQDYADLIKDPAVDAVIVSAPTPLHAEISLAAIEAGKHVLCEMPLAATLEEADKIIDAAEKAGVTLMPGLTFRFTPNYVKAKAMIDDGVLGEPAAIMYREFIPARDLASQWPSGAWVWNLDESGGPLFTLSVWSIDLLRWLLQTEIDQLEAAVKYTKLDRFDGTLGYDANASLRMANGVAGCLQYSGSVVASASGSALEVVGTSGCVIKASNNDLVTLLGEDPVRTCWNVKEPGARMWGHVQQDEYFVGCLREGRQPDIRPEDGRIAMQFALKIAGLGS
jgi:predicted dehydrogenase